MSYVVGFCECCGKILEYDEPVDDLPEGTIIIGNPHYICSDCIEKVLIKESED